MKNNPNEPLNCNNGNGFWNDEFNKTHGGVGLTKREYFAALAMQGLITNERTINIAENLVIDAIKYADALIEQLNNKTEDKHL